MAHGIHVLPFPVFLSGYIHFLLHRFPAIEKLSLFFVLLRRANVLPYTHQPKGPYYIIEPRVERDPIPIRPATVSCGQDFVLTRRYLAPTAVLTK